MNIFYKYAKPVFVLVFSFLLSIFSLKTEATTIKELSRLQRGEIITSSLTPTLKDNLKGAESKVLIKAPPEKVWAILDNQEKLPEVIPRFKKITVLEKTPNSQKVQVALKVCKFLPLFKYTMTLDTREKYKRVKFNKVDGCFKSLYGTYELERYPQGTVLTYRMYVDTGFFVPDFVCKSGLSGDLPDIMSAIKAKAER